MTDRNTIEYKLAVIQERLSAIEKQRMVEEDRKRKGIVRRFKRLLKTL